VCFQLVREPLGSSADTRPCPEQAVPHAPWRDRADGNLFAVSSARTEMPCNLPTPNTNTRLATISQAHKAYERSAHHRYMKGQQAMRDQTHCAKQFAQLIVRRKTSA
jgi:hypothetical protein